MLNAIPPHFECGGFYLPEVHAESNPPHFECGGMVERGDQVMLNSYPPHFECGGMMEVIA